MSCSPTKSRRGILTCSSSRTGFLPTHSGWTFGGAAEAENSRRAAGRTGSRGLFRQVALPHVALPDARRHVVAADNSAAVQDHPRAVGRARRAAGARARGGDRMNIVVRLSRLEATA